MYAPHFGLRTEPFSLTPDPAFFYLSPDHAEALAGLAVRDTASGAEQRTA